MSEIGVESESNISIDGVGEVSTGPESISSPETGSSVVTSGEELYAPSSEANTQGSFETHQNSLESMPVSTTETQWQGSGEINSTNQILEIPSSIEQAQKEIESYHSQSITQILETNGKYMSEADRDRVSKGVDSIQAIEHNPVLGRTGGYLLSNGKSNIEVSAINNQQMERSTKHETNHFASKNREIIVPEPDRKGYTVYQTVGTRQSSWFHSNETGLNYNVTTKGRGLNEGLTTMFTNQQLSEISKEKGEAAERQGVYSHATEICSQLESIVGKDTLKEAYYGGDLKGLETKVDRLAGEKSYESLRDCLDRTLSKDYSERVQAMKEAQIIMNKMYEGGKSA